MVPPEERFGTDVSGLLMFMVPPADDNSELATMDGVDASVKRPCATLMLPVDVSCPVSTRVPTPDLMNDPVPLMVPGYELPTMLDTVNVPVPSETSLLAFPTRSPTVSV